MRNDHTYLFGKSELVFSGSAHIDGCTKPYYGIKSLDYAAALSIHGNKLADCLFLVATAVGSG
jgi:hypothetical protein